MTEASRVPKPAKVVVPKEESKVEKVAEVIKEVAPVVASVAVAAAPTDKKREVKKWTSIGLSALAIILHIVEHLA
jgi:hypothetical protein